VRKIPKTGPSESDLIAAFEKGSLKSVATKAELSKFRGRSASAGNPIHSVSRSTRMAV
jgi:hypothetical protein